MKKKFISIAKKAMVWTMAASMLVATPLTASAKGLSDVYKIEDQWGHNVDENGNKTDVIHGNSATGTVTNTATTVLKEAGIAGIYIEEPDIEENYEPGKTHVLHVSAKDTDGKTVNLADKKLQDKFSWKSSNTAVASFESMTKKQNRDTSSMTLKINGGGIAAVTVSLDDYKNDIHFSDTINVYITQDATKIEFDTELLAEDAVEGESLVLDDYVKVYPETATDTIQYAIVRNVLKEDGKIDSKKQATLKNGVLTFKKKSGVADSVAANKTNSIEIIAIGKKVRSDRETVKIRQQIAATGITFKIKGIGDESFRTVDTAKAGTNKQETYNWLINDDGKSVECEVELVPANSTDRIVSWTSNKTTFATAAMKSRKEDRKGKTAELTAVAKGNAVITVKTSSNKSFKLQAKVDAYLTSIEFDDVKTAYSGQTLQLPVIQRFDKIESDNTVTRYDANNDFKDAGLKWTFDGLGATTQVQKAAKKNVKSLKNGVLTVKPTISLVKDANGNDVDPQVKIVAKNSQKQAKGPGVQKLTVVGELPSITLEQVSVSKIIVNTNSIASDTERVLVQAGKKGNGKPDNKTQKITIAAGDTKTYGLYAVAKNRKGEDIPGNAAYVLGWSVNNAKLAKVKKNDYFGSITGIKRGVPKVTVDSTLNINEGTSKPAKYQAIKVTLNTTVTEHSKTLSVAMKTKNTAIGIDTARPKKQNIVFVATLEKGSSTKAKDIEWTATNLSRNVDVKKLTNGKLVVEKNDSWFGLGDIILVKAQITGTNVSASMRVNVVKKSNKPTITIKHGSTDVTPNKGKYTVDAAIPETGDKDYVNYVITPMIQSTNGENAGVTYTLNNQNTVRIYYDSDEKSPTHGQTVIKPINNGQVTITALTADGVKSTIKVVVTNVDWEKGANVYSVE